MMTPERTPEKVTLEDLLRLKRAERPSPDFWARFEQDLRVKQLAAIIEKRPWWHALHLPQAARVVARFQVPVGAAAVLALSFVAVGQYRSGSGSVDVAAPVTTVAAVQTAAAVPASVQPATAPAISQTESTPAAAVAKADVSRATVATISDGEPVAHRQSELTSMIPWGPAQPEGAAQPISTGLAVAALPDLAVTTLLGGRSAAPEVQTTPARATAPEAKTAVAVAQTISPRELRRARLMAGLVLADNSDSAENSRVMQGRELVTSSLSEEQMYDSVRRIGLGGDRLMVKF